MREGSYAPDCHLRIKPFRHDAEKIPLSIAETAEKYPYPSTVEHLRNLVGKDFYGKGLLDKLNAFIKNPLVGDYN